ncbi:MAG: hypothetical protein V4712_12445 [Pseudomonadota bacterium]
MAANTPDSIKADAALMETQVDHVFSKLTDAQRERVVSVARRAKERTAGPEMAVEVKDGQLAITYGHENAYAAVALLMADMGTCDASFFNCVTNQMANIGSQGRKVDDTASNFLMAVVRAVQPRDELETLLAVQMGAIHNATMMLARRLNHVETIPQQDAAERALNKLARTYAMQMEALKRYRTGGQQKVTVEHVTVNAGGQAIVGAVGAGGRG